MKKGLLATAFAALLAFSGFLAFFRLGVEPFQDYDEATYAEVTRESMARGDYLSLTFLNQEYFRKPPLMFWMAAAFAHVIPSEELAMRLPSALAAFLLVPLAAAVCLAAGAGPGLALLAGAITATTSALMEPARQARFDVLITFFMLLALYVAMRADQERRWYLAVGAALGLAVLTKSVIAVFALPAILVYLIGTQGRRFLRDPWLYAGAGAFLLVAIPWHLYETLRFGAAFWQSYLGNEVIHRAAENLFPGTQSPTNAEYITFLLRFTAPWFGLFCASVLAVPFLWRAWSGRERSLYLACAAAVASVLVVMLASSTKAITYLIPLYPFMAVALALASAAAWRRSSGDMRAALVGALAVSLLIAGFTTVRNVFHLNPYYSIQYALAREERAIAERIVAQDPDPLLYTYKNENLGAIQYYTRLPFTKNPFVYPLESARPDAAPGYIITPATLAELRARFPQFTIKPFYDGSLLSVFTIAS